MSCSAKRDPNGTWHIQYRWTDWTGTKKKSQKRGFKTKKEAEEWYAHFILQQTSDPTMTLNDFWEIYKADMEKRLRKTTMKQKEYVMKDKVLPYFGNTPINAITAPMIRKWQGEMIDKGFKPTYLKTINNQLSSILNYGIFYPVLVAGTEKADIDAGKYGRMWIKYIKEEYPMRYKSLVRFGELEERADEVNDTAYELLDDIEAKWLKKHKPKNPNSFTEQLQLRTQTRMMAEEIVIMDVVMQFH